MRSTKKHELLKQIGRKFLGEISKNEGSFQICALGNWVQCQTKAGFFVTLRIQSNRLIAFQYEKDNLKTIKERNLTDEGLRGLFKLLKIAN